MSKVFTKLGFNGQKRILVLNAPFTFEEHLLEMLNKTIIDRIPLSDYDYDFVLAFAHQSHQAASYIQFANNLDVANPVFWLIANESLDTLNHQETRSVVNRVKVIKGWYGIPIRKNLITNHTSSLENKFRKATN